MRELSILVAPPSALGASHAGAPPGMVQQGSLASTRRVRPLGAGGAHLLDGASRLVGGVDLVVLAQVAATLVWALVARLLIFGSPLFACMLAICSLSLGRLERQGNAARLWGQSLSLLGTCLVAGCPGEGGAAGSATFLPLIFLQAVLVARLWHGRPRRLARVEQ